MKSGEESRRTLAQVPVKTVSHPASASGDVPSRLCERSLSENIWAVTAGPHGVSRTAGATAVEQMVELFAVSTMREGKL